MSEAKKCRLCDSTVSDEKWEEMQQKREEWKTLVRREAEDTESLLPPLVNGTTLSERILVNNSTVVPKYIDSMDK